MGFLDVPCDGCAEKLPLETAASTSDDPPRIGYARNVGSTFNGIFVCPMCWDLATARGFKLNSKEEAKRWKSHVKSSNEAKAKVEKEGLDSGSPTPEMNSSQSLSALQKSKDEAFLRKNKLYDASGQMLEILTPEMERLVADILLPSEKIICKVRSSPSGDRSQLVLTNHNLILISKGLSGGQGQDAGFGILSTIMAVGRISIRIYPIQEIRSIEIQPLQGMTVGHFQILTNATSENDNESKFLFDTDIGYYKSILLYRKIRRLQGLDVQGKTAKPLSTPLSKTLPSDS